MAELLRKSGPENSDKCVEPRRQSAVDEVRSNSPQRGHIRPTHGKNQTETRPTSRNLGRNRGNFGRSRPSSRRDEFAQKMATKLERLSNATASSARVRACREPTLEVSAQSAGACRGTQSGLHGQKRRRSNRTSSKSEHCGSRSGPAMDDPNCRRPRETAHTAWLLAFQDDRRSAFSSGRTLAELGANLVEGGPNSDDSGGQSWPKLPELEPNLVELGPNLAVSGPISAESGPMLDFAKIGSILVDAAPSVGEQGQALIECCRIRAKFGRSRAEIGRDGSSSANIG